MMSFITTKFLEILLSSFRGIALTNCFSNIFHFGQISNFKKGVIPRKKMKSISCGYAYLHMNYVLHNYNVSRNSIERFQRSCADKLFQKYLSFWSNFYVQKGRNSKKKKLNQNSLWICASTHYVFHIYKVSRNSVERYQRSCANKKNRTD